MFLLVVFKRAYRRFNQCVYKAGIDNLQDIDENVDEYFDSLTDKARLFMMKEEQRCRKELGFSILSDDAFGELNERYILNIRGNPSE